MRRISNQVRQRRRQTWLDLPAHGIEEAGNGQEQCRSISESRGEEEIRLHCLPGTRQALVELMDWSGIEEQGEAITLMIQHLHGLGPDSALPLLKPPRHEITVSPIMARKLELAYQREAFKADEDEYLLRTCTRN